MEEIIVQPYDWKIEDVDANSKDADEHVNIHVWALDRDSVPHLIRITDWPATCYIELPRYIGGRYVNWSNNGATMIFEWLKKVLRHHAPTSFKLEHKKGIYYYRGENTSPVILLQFNSLAAVSHCHNLLKHPITMEGINGHINLRVWETNIPIERKLLTRLNSLFCQWIKVKGTRVEYDDCISKLDYEYITSWKDIEAIPEEESEEWVTNPGILAFDFETNSSSGSENSKIKPFPNALVSKDCIFMASMVFWRFRRPETLKRYLLVYGECDPIEDEQVEVICFKTEKELLYAFQDKIIELDPEILTGYNIFGFDWPYIHTRLRRREWEWKNLTRLRDRAPDMKKISWKSSGAGYNKLSYLIMDGRMSMDLLPMVKRDYKLRDYKLDTVAREFIDPDMGKNDVKPEEMFAVCNTMMRTAKLLQKYPNKPDLVNRMNRLKKEMQRVAYYCDKDSILVMKIFEELNVWFASVEMSNITGVSIIDTFTRGQQIRCISAIYNLAHPEGYFIDQRDVPSMPYEGGAVQDPIPGVHDNIPCFDVKSMYPSIMIADNMCHTTLVPPELDDQIPDDQCHVYYTEMDPTQIGRKKGSDDIEEDFYREGTFEDEIVYDDSDDEDEPDKPKKKTITKKMKFVKKEIHEGILPRIVDNYIKKRRQVQAKIKSTKSAVQKVILDKRQWALKICANSMYGFTGAQTGKLSLIEAAICITQRGRQIITETKKYCEEKYGATTVYGDTDSIMPDFHIKDPKEAYAVANKVTEELNQLFPGIVFELEKVMRILCLKKKHYAAFFIDKNGVLKDDPNKMLVRGIPLARRDKCPYLVETFKEILVGMLRKEQMDVIFGKLVDRVADFIEGNFDWKKAVMIRGLGANYKSDSYFMKVFADYLQAEGKPANPGDRLEYVVVDVPGEKKIGKRMRTVEMFDESLQTEDCMKIDIYYYVDNLFQKSLDILFNAVYKSKLENIKDKYGYDPKSRKKFVSIENPVKIMARMMEDNSDVRTLKPWFNKIITKEKLL